MNSHRTLGEQQGEAPDLCKGQGSPKGRALELDLCPPTFMSMEVNEGRRQGPVLQSHTYLDLSPCCVIWDKFLNLSEPRDL